MITNTWRIIVLALSVGVLLVVSNTRGAGVTIITHGLNGNADGWVAGMANQIRNYPSFPGAIYTLYKFYFIPVAGGSYRLTWTRLGGTQPPSTDSGEIIAVLDWSQLANGNSHNTYQIASLIAFDLQDSNFISELNGHALSEFPLHLIGHSRGGSLTSELSLRLGTNGLWVDHLTTLDPHPLNNDGFFDFIYSAVDAPVRTYESVLFHDNYWQDDAFLIYGEPVAGAYIRKLVRLCGGYGGCSGAAGAYHSNVHLWYHGTIDMRNPADDTEAQITDADFDDWYAPYENYGFNAGFRLGLIGGGNRMSSDRPLGTGYPAIREGYNQVWDFGAGLAANRTFLPQNNGTWPNIILLNVIGTNYVQQGSDISVRCFYQWAAPATSTASVSFYLDDDSNPLNNNGRLLQQISAPGTGRSNVNFQTLSLTLNPTNVPAGDYFLYGRIVGGSKTRYLYAPEAVTVIPPPIITPLLSAAMQETNVVLTWPTNAQGFSLQWSTNLGHPVWSNALPSPVIAGEHYVVTNTVTDKLRLYRLEKR